MQQYLIFNIFMYIYQKKKTTAKQIAEAFEISTRSVYRYIDALSSAQIPLYTQNGKNGGIFLKEDFKLDSIYFSEHEKNALKQILENLLKTQKNDLIEKLLKKL